MNFYTIVQKLIKEAALKTEESKNNLCIKKHHSHCNHTSYLIKYITSLALLFFKLFYYQDSIRARPIYGRQSNTFFYQLLPLGKKFSSSVFQINNSLVMVQKEILTYFILSKQKKTLRTALIKTGFLYKRSNCFCSL